MNALPKTTSCTHDVDERGYQGLVSGRVEGWSELLKGVVGRELTEARERCRLRPCMKLRLLFLRAKHVVMSTKQPARAASRHSQVRETASLHTVQIPCLRQQKSRSRPASAVCRNTRSSLSARSPPVCTAAESVATLHGGRTTKAASAPHRGIDIDLLREDLHSFNFGIEN